MRGRSGIDVTGIDPRKMQVMRKLEHLETQLKFYEAEKQVGLYNLEDCERYIKETKEEMAKVRPKAFYFF